MWIATCKPLLSKTYFIMEQDMKVLIGSWKEVIRLLVNIIHNGPCKATIAFFKQWLLEVKLNEIWMNSACRPIIHAIPALFLQGQKLCSLRFWTKPWELGLRGWLCNAELEERDLAGIRAHKCTHTHTDTHAVTRVRDRVNCACLFSHLSLRSTRRKKQLLCWCEHYEEKLLHSNGIGDITTFCNSSKNGFIYFKSMW